MLRPEVLFPRKIKLYKMKTFDCYQYLQEKLLSFWLLFVNTRKCFRNKVGTELISNMRVDQQQKINQSCNSSQRRKTIYTRLNLTLLIVCHVVLYNLNKEENKPRTIAKNLYVTNSLNIFCQ